MVDPFSIVSLTSLGITGLLGDLAKKAGQTALANSVAYLKAPENVRILRRVTWIACVLALLVVSALSITGSHWLLRAYKPGIVVTVALWSILVGATASMLLPAKAIVATFGGLVGVTLSEVGSAAGLISSLRKQVNALAIEFGAILQPDGNANAPLDPFVGWMIWMFIGIVAVLCLPAFFEE
jgi:hypothetical protein